MVRKTVQLDPEQERQLKELAERRGVGESELIREAVEEYLREQERPLTAEENPLLGIIGIGKRGVRDGSESHDRDLDREREDPILGIIGIISDPDAPIDSALRYNEDLYGGREPA